MLYLLLAASLLQISFANPLAEDTQIASYYNPDDDPAYIFMDTRSTKGRDNEIEARRRSTMDKNFVRFGRRDMSQPIQGNNELEYDDYSDDFSRTTRNNNDKSDHFIRFGRGRSDFVRFGRDTNKPTRSNSNYFRFGRSAEPQSKRSKREANFNDAQDFKRNSNFVRFGRNQNFLRFGRPATEDSNSPNHSSPKSEVERLSILTKYRLYQEANFLQYLTDLVLKLKQDVSKCQSQ